MVALSSQYIYLLESMERIVKLWPPELKIKWVTVSATFGHSHRQKWPRPNPGLSIHLEYNQPFYIYIFKQLNIAFEKKLMVIPENKCFCLCCLMSNTQGLVFAVQSIGPLPASNCLTHGILILLSWRCRRGRNGRCRKSRELLQDEPRFMVGFSCRDCDVKS